MQEKTVLLTGVTGFLGSHTAIRLLENSYRVIGTLRDMQRAEAIVSVIGKHAKNIANLHLEQAELMDAEVWDRLTERVDFVLHIASPIPRTLPKKEEDLIEPAKAGTLNVLRASAKNGVKRVVLTSSLAAIAYGKAKDERSGTYTEKNWTDTTNYKDTSSYGRSKTIAERVAWNFIEAEGNGLELVTICPGVILGPVLEKDFGTSANLVIKPLSGTLPAIPKIGFDLVDVRSAADLHLRAMESDAAKNQRFICSSGCLLFKDIVAILKEAYPERKLPSRTLPNFAVRLLAFFDPTLKPVLLGLGVRRTIDRSKATQILDWNPLTPKEAVVSCAQSVFDLGIVR